MKFYILSLIPEVIDAYFDASIMGRAKKDKIFSVKTYNIRKWTKDVHRTVDGSPYGGGPGMVLKIEPIYRAVKYIKNNISKLKKRKKTRVILFSTRGKPFNGKVADRLLKYDNIILICGRYEGVDERVSKYVADEEISVGNYVLSGGEIPAMALIDSVARKIPGVLGKLESLEEIKGSYPVYTRPEKFLSKKTSKKSWDVPKELVSGNHKDIKDWRESNNLEK